MSGEHCPKSICLDQDAFVCYPMHLDVLSSFHHPISKSMNMVMSFRFFNIYFYFFSYIFELFNFHLWERKELTHVR